MKIDCIIGIDPGSNGGLVVWRPNHNATAIKMPKDLNEIRDFLNYYKEIPFVLVNAMKWQNDLKLRIKVKGKKEEKADRKRRFRDIAGKLYPEIAPTLWNADATLIMHFGRFVLQNNPGWVLENLPSQMHSRLF